MMTTTTDPELEKMLALLEEGEPDIALLKSMVAVLAREALSDQAVREPLDRRIGHLAEDTAKLADRLSAM